MPDITKMAVRGEVAAERGALIPLPVVLLIIHFVGKGHRRAAPVHRAK
jgi:hypothetical protein